MMKNCYLILFLLALCSCGQGKDDVIEAALAAVEKEMGYAPESVRSVSAMKEQLPYYLCDRKWLYHAKLILAGLRDTSGVYCDDRDPALLLPPMRSHCRREARKPHPRGWVVLADYCSGLAGPLRKAIVAVDADGVRVYPLDEDGKAMFDMLRINQLTRKERSYSRRIESFIGWSDD